MKQAEIDRACTALQETGAVQISTMGAPKERPDRTSDNPIADALEGSHYGLRLSAVMEILSNLGLDPSEVEVVGYLGNIRLKVLR